MLGATTMLGKEDIHDHLPDRRLVIQLIVFESVLEGRRVGEEHEEAIQRVAEDEERIGFRATLLPRRFLRIQDLFLLLLFLVVLALQRVDHIQDHRIISPELRPLIREVFRTMHLRQQLLIGRPSREEMEETEAQIEGVGGIVLTVLLSQQKVFRRSILERRELAITQSHGEKERQTEPRDCSLPAGPSADSLAVDR